MALERAARGARLHRRALHRRAELGWCEFATTAYVRDRLHALGVDRLVWGRDLLKSVARLGLPRADVRERARRQAIAWGVPESDVAEMDEHGTGVAAEIGGANLAHDGPIIGLRVDMDALPIVESDSAEHFPAREGFASEVAGVMHACGHDGHVALGLAVAEALVSVQDELPGTVRLLFQPAEEGTRGALAFVDADWLDDVDILFALHISGLSGLHTGAYSPGVDDLLATIKFDVVLHGRAAHYASAPEKGRSALAAASAIALLSQGLPRPPGTRALINVGRLDSGTARNVVPEHGQLEMEVRAETDEQAADLFAHVERLVSGVGMGLEVETGIQVVGRSPAAGSDKALASVVAAAGEKMALARFDGLTMEASDDAAAMMRRVQERGGRAVYLKVGSDLAGGNHTPTFDFDERCLPIGVELLTRSILASLDAGSPKQER